MEGISKAVELTCSPWGLDAILDDVLDLHLQYVHRARQVMIRRWLPAATRILDLGGANAPLYRMGYRHRFDRMVLVDLPPEDRHAAYRDTLLDAPDGCGEVVLHWSDMCAMPGVPAESFDLVWCGQAIEHVSTGDAMKLCREAFRCLEPGGRFCLDTPNRHITAIHTQDWHGGYVHPDHRYEYRAHELRAMLEGAGFEVIAQRGICEMPVSFETGRFDYSDFILGNPLTDNAEAAYCLYFEARKP